MRINFDNANYAVFQTVQRVAIYRNADNDIVIAQEGLLGREDSFVCIPISHISDVLRELNNISRKKNISDSSKAGDQKDE